MRTLTVKKGGGGSNYTVGWHTLTVSNAKYGDYNGAKFLDIWFDGYPENFTMRVYEKKGPDGEEFAIGQVFRFANAGITDGLDGPDGNVVVKIDDDANHLRGKEINVFFHVEYWKGRAEKYYQDYVLKNTDDTTTTSTPKNLDAVPF